MNDDEERVYPTAGSPGEELYGLTESEMDDRLVRVPGDEGLSSPPDLAGLRPERVFGWSHWRTSDRSLWVTAQFPPMEGRPMALVLGVTIGRDEFALSQMRDLGFPIPDSDPAFIVEGSSQHGRTTVWAPGPLGLAVLYYRAVGDEYPVTLQVCSESPPEPELREMRTELEDEFDWEGTLRFASQESLSRGEVEEHIPPGRIRARMIL